MKSNLTSRLRIITTVFVLTSIALALNGWFTYRNLQGLQDHQWWVSHTHEVIYELERTISGLKDAETSQRGYIIRKSQSFLGVRNGGIESMWKHFMNVRNLTIDNPLQVANCAELERMLQTRVRFMEESLATFEAKGKLAGSFETGQDAMDAVRRQIDAMGEQERSLLGERNKATDSQKSFLVLTLIGSTILSVLFALVTFLIVRKQYMSQHEISMDRAREASLKSAEAEISALALKDSGVRPISEGLVRYVCDQLNAPAANLYCDERSVLLLTAGYSLEEGAASPGLRESFKSGESMLGRAAELKTIRVVSDIPADYFKISSSLGESKPNHIAFVPMNFQSERIGVMEVAFFATPTADQLEWLEVVAVSAAAGLSSARHHERLQTLLEETQRQSEELQMQQEELRTTNEELEEQTKALMQAQERMQLQTEELRQVNEELEQQARNLESQQDALNVKNRDLENSSKSLEDKALELERASAYKSDFLAKMSHELRTPLNSLMILATLLQENKKGNLDIQQVEFARTIFEAGTDLLDLINDILDLSKIEAKKLQVRAEPLSIPQFLEQITNLFMPQVEARGLVLKFDIEKDAPIKISTDRQRLQQILRNFIGNAMKFTENGSITLRAQKSARGVAVIVEDTGIGIPAEKMKLIWEAFEQADGSISRRYGGTGLGLTISRELTQLLKGEIRAESEPGKGSRFIIDLPIDLDLGPTQQADISVEYYAAPAAEEKPPTNSILTANTNPNEPVIGEPRPEVLKLLGAIKPEDRTILVVEDDEKFRDAVAEAIRMQKFTPLPVGDSESALELLEKHTPRAILLDIRLPGISGLALLDIIKKRPSLRHVPIHMISALERQQSAMRMGAIGYLGKPVTIDGVRGALNRIESVIDRKVKRLLVVEDDSRQRKIITDLIAGSDVEIQSVGTGREALEVLRRNDADCVVLDLKLPDMTGFDLLENLNQESELSLPPVIVYTGKDLSRDEEERLRRYSDSIIIKGAKSPERLLDEVSLFIHRVESTLPQDKRAMLTDVRGKNASFDGRKILLVDDDIRNLFALTSALEAKGFAVTVARDGLEAVEKVDTMPDIDCVLMDIMMPKMDGFEAMKRIRSNPKNRALPIIALTAKAMAGEHERCVAAGANDYLPKPIDLSSLLSVLKVWLPSQGIMS